MARRPRLGGDDKAPSEAEVAAMVGYLARRAVAERRRGVPCGPRTRDLLIVELLAATGLRARELAALRLRDVHLARKRSYLRVHGGKHRERRDVDTVPIAWELVPELERWIAARIAADPAAQAPLFTAAQSGRALNRHEVWRAVKRAVRGAGCRDVLTAHSLRHYYATRVALASKSSAVVQRALRLRTARIADTYVHTALEDAAAVIGPMRLPGRRRRSGKGEPTT